MITSITKKNYENKIIIVFIIIEEHHSDSFHTKNLNFGGIGEQTVTCSLVLLKLKQHLKKNTQKNKFP